ncbi:GntR family transcriptional regulator [Streptomyces sp. NPDC087440]|uniref:GntR family transcriptional regulator n=1 Tax=Streptomyces sp. NPDC087440 TaxID=3365790 RepID=UPI0037F5F29B
MKGTVPLCPKWARAVQFIRRRIADGTYQAGEPLPPSRQLRRVCGISEGTLHKALHHLANEGLVQPGRQGGQGAYVLAVPRAPTADVVVARTLQDHITQGVYEPGMSIPLNKVALDLDEDLRVVRAAARLLHGEGLASIRSSGGGPFLIITSNPTTTGSHA